MIRKLGKLPPRHDIRTLRLARYTASLPPAPLSTDWSAKLTNLGMMANDALGDCTCAAIGHIIQTWTANNGDQVILSDADIVALYEQACDYDPSNPATDQGGVELDVLNYWRKNGVASHGLDGFAAVMTRDPSGMRDAVWLFGAAYVGLALPITAQSQDVWDVPNAPLTGDAAPGSWGGHAVPIIAYDGTGLLCITWGEIKRMTWAFWEAYGDEAYACLSKDWTARSGAPSGFAWDALEADLAGFARAA
jgi:hypothetical protein